MSDEARPRLGTSPPLDPWSGGGVYQRHVLRRLRHAFVVQEGARAAGDAPPPTLPGRVRRLARSLRPPAPCDVFLNTATPMPLLPKATPVVGVVFDLRWQRESRPAHRTYRWLELRRLCRRAVRLVVISDRTRADLCEEVPDVEGRVELIHPGPGQFDSLTFVDKEFGGRVLLMGRSPHKRNELAAAALLDVQPDWCIGVIGVNVADAVQRRIRDSPLGRHSLWLERPGEQELRDVLEREAAIYLNLSVEEGFGFPYIEALAAGCHVIAADCALTREVVGEAAWLLPAGSIGDVVDALGCSPVVRSSAARKTCAAVFNWERCADELIAVVRSCLGRLR